MPDRITTIFEYSISKSEVLVLIDGVLNIEKFTEKYLKNDDIKYDVLITDNFHTTHHRYCFSSDYLIYINKVLVFQKCNKYFNDSILRKNISNVKKIMDTKTYEEKEIVGNNNVDYLHREWSIIAGLPVIIDCKYDDSILYITVYSQENENIVYESEEEFDTEYEAVNYAELFENTLYHCYNYNENRQELVHCEDEDE